MATTSKRDLKMGDLNDVDRQRFGDLMRAIIDHKLVRFKAVLEAAGDSAATLLRCRDGHAFTPLMSAVEHRQVRMVELLAGLGADLDPLYETGVTPLFRAVLMKDMRLIKVLVSRGANKDFVSDSTGSSLLMRAIPLRGGNPEVALYLIAQGAACGEDVKSKLNETALSLACKFDNDAVFFPLVRAGALAGAGREPLEYAVSMDAVRIVQRCLDDPELRGPASGDRGKALIENCFSQAVRQVLLSWRSQYEIEAAVESGAGSELAPSPVRSRSIPSL